MGAVTADTRRAAKSSACALVADPGLDHHELVTAKPRRNVVDAGHRAQAFGHRLQKKIAGVVAKGIVYLLEAVEIDEVQGKAAPPNRKDGQRFLQLLKQLGAVDQARQRVMMGEKTDAPIGHLLLFGPAIPGDRRNAKRLARQTGRALPQLSGTWH